MNPGRTGRRVINVDFKDDDQKMNIKGELPVLLSELEYIIADLYITLHMERGISNKDIDTLFDEVKNNGMKSAWKIIKEVRKIEG